MSHFLFEHFLYEVEKTELFCEKTIRQLELPPHEIDWALRIHGTLTKLYSKLMRYRHICAQDPNLSPTFTSWMQDMYSLLDDIRRASSSFDFYLEELIRSTKQLDELL